MARQGELFGPSPIGGPALDGARQLPLQAHQLQEWQGRLANHQHPLLSERASGGLQASLFDNSN
ncbi:MAG: GIY-YIG nuclease family protein, partial [Cyanobium sp.]